MQAYQKMYRKTTNHVTSMYIFTLSLLLCQCGQSIEHQYRWVVIHGAIHVIISGYTEYHLRDANKIFKNFHVGLKLIWVCRICNEFRKRFHLRCSSVTALMSSWEQLMQTCWWPLNDHLRARILLAAVCVVWRSGSWLELSALCNQSVRNEITWKGWLEHFTTLNITAAGKLVYHHYWCKVSHDTSESKTYKYRWILGSYAFSIPGDHLTGHILVWKRTKKRCKTKCIEQATFGVYIM